MKKEIRDRIIHEIIENFDYEKVLVYMKENNWNHGNKVPTLESLMTLSRGLLEDLLDNENMQFISTGGFYAIRNRGYTELIFGIESSFSEEKTSVDSDKVSSYDNQKVDLNLLLNSYDKLKEYTDSLEKELEFYRRR